MEKGPVPLLKVGGSVLRGILGYRTAAAFLRRQLITDPRLVVVVSAEQGQTDALLAEAFAFGAEPDRGALDLLWSTGELRSVALLTLALRAACVDATGLNAHETGLRADAGSLDLNPIAIRAALAAYTVVVVPGFLAARNHRIVTLGRGGSDWSAVQLAASLGASRCELIKDVDGYFTADPHVHADARLIPAIDIDGALQLAAGGCPLVQPQALAAARDARLPLVVRSFTSTGTFVHPSNP